MKRIEFFVGTEQGAHGALDPVHAAYRHTRATGIVATYFSGATELVTRGFWENDPPEAGLYFIVIAADPSEQTIKACAEELRVTYDQTAVLVAVGEVVAYEVRANA